MPAPRCSTVLCIAALRSTSVPRLFVLALLIVVSGSAQASPGELDPGFAEDGKVVTSFAARDARAYAVAIQPDGRIVVAGAADSGDAGDFALARYGATGRLDRSFGSSGTVTTSLGNGYDAAASVALQPDGRIVAAGLSFDARTARYGFALVRYNPNGSLDQSFGSGGKVTTSFEGGVARAHAVLVQPDGKIVAAGMMAPIGTFDSSFALVRYNADGSVDKSFGFGGRVVTGFGERSSFVTGVALQPDGRIVAAGSRFESGGFTGAFYGFALARYESDGSLDRSFGVGGAVTTRIGSGGSAAAIALQPDGRIVVAGSTIGAFSDVGMPESDFALARYLPEGSLDPSFGSGGRLTTDLDSDARADAVAVGHDGRIVVAGTRTDRRFSFAVARYAAQGSLDPSFGHRGVMETRFGGNHDEASSVAVQRNGKVVVAGSSYDAKAEHMAFALARYLDEQAICRVPKVTGRALPSGRRALARAHCSTGRISRAF